MGGALNPLPAPVVTHVDDDLWVWDEGRVDAEYGGNKVRKLQGLLPAALASGAAALVTVGGTGSHHVLATAVHGARAGLATHAVLFDQPERPDVLAHWRQIETRCASVTRVASPVVAFARARALAALRRAAFVPPGGTSVVGTVGWCGAARTVARRVLRGELPRPERVYVALGTGGTAAGLLAGFGAEGLCVEVVAVRVVPRFAIGGLRVRTLAERVLRWMELPGSPAALRVAGDALSGGYGVVDEVVEAAMAEGGRAGVHLERTYTAKAFGVWCRERRSGHRAWFVATAPAAGQPADRATRARSG